MASRYSTIGIFGAWWGVLGTVFGLYHVCWGLLPLVEEMFATTMTPLHWAALAACIVFMAWSEGYRGFQRSFSPRVAERAALLRSEPTPARVVAAPLYVMGFFSAPKPVLIIIYVVTVGVIILVQLVRMLEQPWRGIVDAGVIVGLGWGATATLIYGVRRLRSDAPGTE